MNNIREISDLRVASLEKLSSKPVNINELEHMKSASNCLDLDKAKNWQEVAAADRITKDPKRQSKNENDQLITLLGLFPNIKKPSPKTYLVNGNLITNKSQLSEDNPADLDAIFEDNDWTIGWTLKGGQEVDGTAQHRQFLDVEKTISQAPGNESTNKVMLAVFVNGDFWIRSRPRKYKEYKIVPPFSLIDILKEKAKGKKCIIFSDESMPVKLFYETYIKETNA